jgi:DNA-binding PadR family transcriptional regulator
MNRDEFARNLAAGTYDLIVLDVLRDGPSYGYGIVKRIFEQSRHSLRWREGTIYPVLHRLEKQGLLTSEWKTVATEPKMRPRSGKRGPTRERRYYRLTARGKRVWRERRAHWQTFARAVSALLDL